jgi:hypothetical protein
MALPYRKWTDEEIRERSVTPEGDYNFVIIDALRDKTKPGLDKNGNPKEIYDMLVIEFEFKDGNGVIKKQKDWIVFMDGMDWKLRHLARSTNTLELYENDTLDCHHLKNKRGLFSLGIKDFIGNDGTKKKMNFVKDYVSTEKTNIHPVKEIPPTKQNSIPAREEFINDDIPF